ncbi:uncharacterized protein TNCV_1232371 [Trichonephila clavipes]|nr:uncharacterized protein TNCV_1232371 [Trichonephila clavipes]
MKWNDLLPAEEYREWHQFLVSLENINNIETQRCILVAFPEAIENHGFADASESLTIPRLELCAAVLLAKLVKRVVASLQLETAKIYLWSDSIIVLAWLRKELMDLKTFVKNRVAKIQEPNQLWRHVPSDQNPADLVSRGVDHDKLLQRKLWFNGPTFLSGDDYPNRTINCSEKLDEYNSELKLWFVENLKGISGVNCPVTAKEFAKAETFLVLDESRSFFRVHTGYFSNIPKCIKAEFIASWACSQSSVVSSSKR